MLSHDNTLALNIYYSRLLILRIYADIIYSGTNGQKLEMSFQFLVYFLNNL